ncbi:hypothetical protein BZL41_24205 [Pseudomonas sp. PIC25]|uniref:hypothetical protein n=1 Tax=Pseudomonas sp. PIC25 TaxID=1958773 RepID=UPI000BAB62A1|nr:hypothetical protein [Pseudomonas sp. PIC25]PAU52941.1 hypothetical protein BZL41_24205 [Pseudomonas sp. PIC25]
MKDPLDRATSHPPPTLGEGCVRRYDPEALRDEDGTEFPGAEALWRSLHPDEQPAQPDGKTDGDPPSTAA